jgi:hypothetical protein
MAAKDQGSAAEKRNASWSICISLRAVRDPRVVVRRAPAFQLSKRPLARWVRGLALFNGVAAAAVLPASALAAEGDNRFEALNGQLQHFSLTDFHESARSGDVAVSGSVANATFSTTLQIPHLADGNDTFVYALQYARDFYAFPEIEHSEPASALSTDVRTSGAAFGPRAPFENLQLFRALWTYRHHFTSGYNFYLHNRTGLHGDQLRLDSRWVRIGIAAAVEREFSATHSLGGGLIALVGIGGLEPIPFLRYRYQQTDFRVSVLLPLYARFYANLGRNVELGLVLEADGNRYRVDRADVPFDNVDSVYSYWGPSLRCALWGDLFLRGDVGLSGLRVLDLYFDQALVSSLDLGQSIVSALSLSFEPSY